MCRGVECRILRGDFESIASCLALGAHKTRVRVPVSWEIMRDSRPSFDLQGRGNCVQAQTLSFSRNLLVMDSDGVTLDETEAVLVSISPIIPDRFTLCCPSPCVSLALYPCRVVRWADAGVVVALFLVESPGIITGLLREPASTDNCQNYAPLLHECVGRCVDPHGVRCSPIQLRPSEGEGWHMAHTGRTPMGPDGPQWAFRNRTFKGPGEVWR